MANSKKTKKRKNNKNKVTLNKNIILIVSILIVIIIAVILGLVLSNSNNKVTCLKKTSYKNGVKQSNDITINLDEEKIENVHLVKTIYVDEKLKQKKFSYAEVIKESLKNVYLNSDVENKITNEKNKVVLDLTYKNKKNYILDNVEVIIKDDNVSVNLITEDNFNNYASIDLSKRYTKDKIINNFESKGFTCK